MKYTEKADIAAKAVKVLDSVTMRRHKAMAVRYFEQAVKAITGLSIAKCISWKSSRADAVFTDRIEQARLAMENRLNKPRYTLKNGEWVNKDDYVVITKYLDDPLLFGKDARKVEKVTSIRKDSAFMATQAKGDAAARGLAEIGSAVAAPKHKYAQRPHNLQMANMAAQMNVNPHPLYGPHNALVGSAPYDHRGQ